MHTGRFWDLGLKKHASGDGPKAGPSGRAYSAFPIDWDDDGDFDLIVGNDKGGIFLRENQGTAKSFQFTTESVALMAGGKPAVVPSGYAMPVAADWDGDGAVDLISGAHDGSVWWFRNEAKSGAPKLAKPRELIPAARDDDDAEDDDAKRQEHAQVEVVDFDGDGDLDLLVGDSKVEFENETLSLKGSVWLYRRSGSPTQSAQTIR